MILKENLIDLKAVIAYNEETKSLIAEIKKESEGKIAQLLESRKDAVNKEKEVCLKNVIESSAKKEFDETKKKSLLGGIGIRESSIMVYDEKLAYTWCEEHKVCLQLDKKAFEKLAETQKIDFVTTGKEVKVTFPKVIKIEE